MLQLKYLLCFILLINISIYSQEKNTDIEEDEYIYLWDAEGITIFGEYPSDPIETEVLTIETNNDIEEDEYIYLWDTEGITIFGEFPSDSVEAEVLTILNGSLSNRKQFIENDLLEHAGFRRTATVRYRRSDASEKVSSVLYGIAHAFSFGIVSMKPFFEIDYDRLPKGEYYSFGSVIISSEFNDISENVLSVLELEYMLQIEFCNGILFEYNRNYYTEENINKFESLIFNLPNSPESIWQLKERYLNIELPKIKNALERYNNPSEDYLRAIQNLENLFRNRN